MTIALGNGVALSAVSRRADAQPAIPHHWTRLSSDAQGEAWMDTTHRASQSGHLRVGWYKTEAAHETKYTVVQYAIDCQRFMLSVRHAITYDGSGTALMDDRTPRPFFAPPFILSLQTFMHIVCDQPIPH
jgi:hypothetical protein